MCRCILLDKSVHDKHNTKLHWTRVEQTSMHNYAQFCTCIIPPPCFEVAIGIRETVAGHWLGALGHEQRILSSHIPP